MNEHKSLSAYRKQWIGKRVEYELTSVVNGMPFHYSGLVDGVGDDGAQAARDGRRRPKPTGLLIVKRDVSGIIDHLQEFECRITASAKS